MSFIAAKLLGKEVKDLDDKDIDDLLASLTPEELEQLSNEVDPDVSSIFLLILPLFYLVFKLLTDYVLVLYHL